MTENVTIMKNEEDMNVHVEDVYVHALVTKIKIFNPWNKKQSLYFVVIGL